MKKDDRYLMQRGERWYYVRRVPNDVAGLVDKPFIRQTLKTRSLETARLRRDAMEEADEIYWASLRSGSITGENAYRAAKRRALGYGLTYRTAPEIADQATINELLERIAILERAGTTREADVEAVLGGAEKPRPSISQVLQIYFNDICADEIKYKSARQLHLWKRLKMQAVNNFIDLVGDKPVEDITRQDALKVHSWWNNRIVNEGLAPNTAKRVIGNLRLTLASYAKYVGDDDYVNPFRGLSFKVRQTGERPPFETEWIRNRIMAPNALPTLNREARCLVYGLIETGARPSELANLLPEQIMLDCPVPHIDIRPREKLEIKTRSSVRKIPLVGVSLAAFQAMPEGFPRYRDKGNTLSQTLLKAFRKADLLPTGKHVIYSLRHSFEKRMEEGGLDYGLRMRLMGHSTDRPEYGDGGSLEYRRDQLLKIVLPFDAGLFHN